MTSFHRILFPVDFSEQSTAIVPAVKAMVERFESELIVLHVVGLPLSLYGTPDAAAWAALINAGHLRENGRLNLDRFTAKHFSGMRVISRLDEGDAARSIVEIAEDERAGLIMMPTRGLGRFRALLLGSVTAKVLHDVNCPVWTGVHAEQSILHPPDKWKNMLCAVDTSSQDLQLLQKANDFASQQGLNLRLVHAVRGADKPLTVDDRSLYEFLMNVASEQIAKMQSQLGTQLDVCLLPGDVGAAVRQAALGHAADIVMIGRGVIQEWLGRLRTTTYSIIRDAPCPVISL